MDLQIIDHVVVKYNGEAEAIELPEGITAIGDDAFQEHKTVKSILLPESIRQIGKWAFSRCTALTEIKIPQGVTQIGLSAFRSCTQLSSITIPESMELIMGKAFEFCKSLQAVEIPGRVETIREKTFSNSIGLKKAIIGEGIREIGAWAFEGCAGLDSITLADSVERIGESAFSECRSLSEVKFGNGIKEIGYNAFAETAWLENHTEDYVRIGTVLIKYRGNAKSAAVPENITVIGCGAFEFCREVEHVILHPAITAIGEKAFYCCTGLTEVTIPAALGSLCGDAFRSCESLSLLRITGCLGRIDISSDLWRVYREIDPGRKMELMLYIPREAFKLKIHAVISCGSNGLQIDYKSYDEKFDEITDLCHKSAMAVLRLLFPVALSDERYADYLRYLQEHNAEAALYFVQTNQFLYLRVLGSIALIPAGEINSLIQMSTDAEQVEMTCYLLSYKNKNIGYEAEEWVL